ncbi:MAG: hypothetical protein IKP72_00190 [Clostridia bacterium]|nr:hypothetical protein [Clostridia bacterium]
MKNDRVWDIATAVIGLLFWVLVLLEMFVLKETGTAYKVIAVAVGVCFLALQIRRIVFTLKKKNEPAQHT